MKAIAAKRRRIRILMVNDDRCGENLLLIADTSISGARVAQEPDALVGEPNSIVSDNGHWRYANQTALQ